MEYFSLNRWRASYLRTCLKTLLLVEAINKPDGAMPGGLDNVRDGVENMVEVSSDQRE